MTARSAIPEYVHSHRVRYRECDPMGVVYHAHYLDYFEAARTEALRSMGLTYREVEASKIKMPVTEAIIRYRAPALYDDLLEIVTRFPAEPEVRLVVEYEVRRAGETAILASGTVTLCFIDTAAGRPVRAPRMIKDVFVSAGAPAHVATKPNRDRS